MTVFIGTGGAGLETLNGSGVGAAVPKAANGFVSEKVFRVGWLWVIGIIGAVCGWKTGGCWGQAGAV